MTWCKTNGLCWERSDGATVRYAMGPDKLDYIAFKPDPSQEYLGRTTKRSRRGLIWPRRWKTSKAAMRAVDREFTLKDTP